VARYGLPWMAGAGLAGIVAARTLLRKRRPAPATAPAAAPDPRADELRQKLAEARDIADERDEFEAAETTVDNAEPPADVAARRREVHERGRAAADEMRGGDS
jgi:hypothetical protein